MDTVPYNFVESVIELLGMKALTALYRSTRNVKSRTWKCVAKLHRANRQYYKGMQLKAGAKSRRRTAFDVKNYYIEEETRKSVIMFYAKGEKRWFYTHNFCGSKGCEDCKRHWPTH
ncbi:hypothetical protein QR680_014590 [Steinernema hermaphroditum]|uniref:Uncharacterized protein n=1 Tax=Steinernema hermaphroditum TaxID=289476 RepID=A0AA39I9G4_9BILA|nr:hypothetical protein QR680_014590 [Steinernema hermaphroditum]